MMKAAIIILLTAVSFSAFAQKPDAPVKVDTLTLPVAEVKKIEDINKSLEGLADARKQIEFLESMKSVIIESAFNHKGIPVPQRKEYSNGKVLYIKDETKKEK